MALLIALVIGFALALVLGLEAAMAVTHSVPGAAEAITWLECEQAVEWLTLQAARRTEAVLSSLRAKRPLYVTPEGCVVIDYGYARRLLSATSKAQMGGVQ